MSKAIDRELIRSLFLNNTPLIDVRAPIEFSQGAFPKAMNYPLMNDQERHDVGVCYKQKGQAAAIKLGHKLVSGDIKQHRLELWQNFAKQHPDAEIIANDISPEMIKLARQDLAEDLKSRIKYYTAF